MARVIFKLTMSTPSIKKCCWLKMEGECVQQSNLYCLIRDFSAENPLNNLRSQLMFSTKTCNTSSQTCSKFKKI